MSGSIIKAREVVGNSGLTVEGLSYKIKKVTPDSPGTAASRKGSGDRKVEEKKGEEKK
ncbi:MAG: hypothetical protein GDA43_00505 [Hormoscilla sp. SP5CHS1]|nr:hypothetical protein [Hormoscilla sp. SP12CHS1]MBC6451850.1 hypothetical protein [Hormoscilla sp. SP5CHS1]